MYCTLNEAFPRTFFPVNLQFHDNNNDKFLYSKDLNFDKQHETSRFATRFNNHNRLVLRDRGRERTETTRNTKNLSVP